MTARRAALVFLASLLLLAAPARSPAQAPRDDPPRPRTFPDAVPGYKKRVIEGFTLLISNDALSQDVSRYVRKPIEVLELELKTIRQAIRPRDVKVLQKGVPIWVEWDNRLPDQPLIVARYYGGSQLGLLRKGENPLKANCVEVLTLKRLAEIHQPDSRFQQCILLHEFAHAIHYHVLSDQNPAIRAAYVQARERGLYDNVEDSSGRRGPAYARASEGEYFAELTCAYLDRCTYFPFTRDDLRKHDPAGFKLMESIWGKPYQQVLAEKPRPSEPSRPAPAASVPAALAPAALAPAALAPAALAPAVTAAPVAPPPPPPDAEATAARRLKLIRDLVAEGKPRRARERLEELIRLYPTTPAAADARRLLETLAKE